MTLKKIFLLMLFLVSPLVTADEIKSIRIFYSDSIKVINDEMVPEGVLVYLHNMDSMEHSEKKMTGILKNKVDSKKSKSSLKDAYSQAFSEVLNSPSWDAHYQDIVASTEAQEKAVRFGIEKIPAILFNDKSIVYGVSSLKEAIHTFNNKGDKR